MTCWMPRERQKADQDDEVNWEPQSEVTVAGTPKSEIHSTRASAYFWGSKRRAKVEMDGPFVST